MSKRIGLISAVLTVAGLSLTIAIPTAAAKRLDSVLICDNTSTIHCLSMNGTGGDDVYTKVEDQSNGQEDIGPIYLQAPNCPNGVSKVQDGADGDDNCNGISEYWPSTSQTRDENYGAGNVVNIKGTNSGNCAVVSGSTTNVTQASSCTGTGHEWIFYPEVTGEDGFLNVHASDSGNNAYGLCDQGANQPVLVQTSCGAAENEWSVVNP